MSSRAFRLVTCSLIALSCPSLAGEVLRASPREPRPEGQRGPGGPAGAKGADLLGRAAARVKDVEQLLATGDAFVRAGKATEAKRSYRQAMDDTLKHRIGGALRAEVLARLQTSRAVSAADRRRQKLHQALETDPDNARARTDLVKLYLVSHDSPAKAAKLLTDAVDKDFQQKVKLSAKPADEADEAQCLRLGQWYADLARDRRRSVDAKALALRRAVAWHEACLGKHKVHDAAREKAVTGLLRLRAESAAADEASTPKTPPLKLKLPRKAGESLVFKGHTSGLTDLAVSPDSSLVASTSKDGTIRFWEMATARQIKRLKWSDSGEPYSVWFSPDGTKLLVAGKDNKKDVWRIYDVATCNVPDLPGAKGEGRCEGFHADGESIIILEGRRWSYGRAKDIWNVAGKYVALRPDGGLFITNTRDGLVLWDGRSGTELLKFGFGDVRAEFSPDSKYLLFKQPAGPIMYDGQTCKKLWESRLPAAYPGEFSPDSSTLLYLGEGGTKQNRTRLAVLYNVRTGKEHPLPIGGKGNYCMARFMADGDGIMFAYFGGGYHIVMFYNRKTGKGTGRGRYRGRLYRPIGPRHLLVPSDKVGTANVFSLHGLR